MIIQNYAQGWNDIRRCERNSYFRAGLLVGMGLIVIVMQLADWLLS